jgi:hypothetical protein
MESVAEDECDDKIGYDEDKCNSGTDTGIHSDKDTDDDYDSGSQLMREENELCADDYGDYADYDVDQGEYNNGTSSDLDPDVADNDIDDDHEPQQSSSSSSSKFTANCSSKSTGTRFNSSSSSTKSRKRKIEKRDESVADNCANGTDHGIDEHEIDSVTDIEYSNGKFDGNTIDSRNIKDCKRIRVRSSNNYVVKTSSKRTSTLSASSTNQKKIVSSPSARRVYKKCPHGKRLCRCKKCPGGGKSFCKHLRDKSECKECGGTSRCEHGNIRGKCNKCGGISICICGKSKS